ncbi:hypothetical protein HMN09_01126500 [Mycena chlorophos]|uniref:DUF7730 domain-containing protein n=1 Tax=Mycena chlorophos TaxID=658473 RepID=A0A8H6VZC0_MYCCL|nr:hypothetical protein HMN09_01126500 [Mycena chlorophos]
MPAAKSSTNLEGVWIAVGTLAALALFAAGYLAWRIHGRFRKNHLRVPHERLNISSGQRAEQPQNSPCAFFSLPRELRQLVYGRVLGGRRVRMFMKANGDPTKHQVLHAYSNARSSMREEDILMPANKRDAPCVSLLRGCRQIYLEAWPVFITQNTFCVDALDLRDILGGLGDFALPHIRALCVHYNIFPPNPGLFRQPSLYSFELLRKMTSLRVLECQFNENPLDRFGYAREVWTTGPNREFLKSIHNQSPWGEIVYGLTALREFSMAATSRGQVVALGSEWKELETNIRVMVC